MNEESLISADRTLAPGQCVASLPWRGLLLHPHFRMSADLPPSLHKRQRPARSVRRTPESDAERALRQQRMREIMQNTTPQEREIIRKLGFKVREALRQASNTPA
jgi:hypothetical protein